MCTLCFRNGVDLSFPPQGNRTYTGLEVRRPEYSEKAVSVKRLLYFAGSGPDLMVL